MTYGLIFWENSCYSKTIFRLQKGIIRIMVGIRDRDLCREYFRELKVLPLQPQYIYSLSSFMINNKHHFKVNYEIHNINTRTKSDLHYLWSHLSVYEKRTFYTRIKVFSSLPVPIKDLSHNIKQFKSALKDFLYFHSSLHWENSLNAR
jgi:hypothetical protein